MAAAEEVPDIATTTQPPVQQEPPEPSNEEEKKDAQPSLRWLGLVRLVAAHAVVCLVALYGLAKSRAGHHRPAVDKVESAVARLVGPVYHRFRDTPLALLIFLDHKVDAMLQELGRKLPPRLSAALSQADTVARDVPEVAREFLSKARRSGVWGATCTAYVKVKPVAKGLYRRCAPVVGQLVMSTCRSIKNQPLFTQAAEIAHHWAERYNRAIDGSRFLPPIPTKRIAKFFNDSSD